MPITRPIAPTHARLVERESTADPTDPAALVLKALQIIDEHFAEDLSVQTIANRLQVSRQTLGAHFRKRVGLTCADYRSLRNARP